jgi:CheY-like chemotaxis protein
MKKTVLVIDDNIDDLEFYCDLLQQSEENYVVATFDNGKDALAFIQQNDVYCIFVDYNLPEMNGIKIIESVYSADSQHIIPTVILTGEPNQAVQAEAAREGALDYLVKDVTNSTNQLDEIIVKVVSWASTLEERNW